jgi:hypothetical protein
MARYISFTTKGISVYTLPHSDPACWHSGGKKVKMVKLDRLDTRLGGPQRLS